jgi:hypothetical protein
VRIEANSVFDFGVCCRVALPFVALRCVAYRAINASSHQRIDTLTHQRVSAYRRISAHRAVSVAAFCQSLFLYGCTERNIKAFYKKMEISFIECGRAGNLAADNPVDPRDGNG